MSSVESYPEAERIPEDLIGLGKDACKIAGIDDPDDTEARRALWEAVDAWDRMTIAIYDKDSLSYKTAKKDWDKAKSTGKIITEFVPPCETIFISYPIIYEFYANARVAYTTCSIERLQLFRQIRDHAEYNKKISSAHLFDKLHRPSDKTKIKYIIIESAWKKEKNKARPNLQPWINLSSKVLLPDGSKAGAGESFEKSVAILAKGYEDFLRGKLVNRIWTPTSNPLLTAL